MTIIASGNADLPRDANPDSFCFAIVSLLLVFTVCGLTYFMLFNAFYYSFNIVTKDANRI